jgi:hypothetical protein
LGVAASWWLQEKALGKAPLFIVYDPAVQVVDIHEYAPIRAHGRELARCDHVLNRFFGAAQIDRRLLDRQQAASACGVTAFEPSEDFVCEELRE